MLSQCAAILLLTLVRPAAPSTQPRPTTRPNHAAARENAYSIFNTVHGAMRQWDSSVHHNGVSFFPLTVPAGVLFFHGSGTDEPPSGPEWLAFEMEHAEGFAHVWRPRDPERPGKTGDEANGPGPSDGSPGPLPLGRRVPQDQVHLGLPDSFEASYQYSAQPLVDSAAATDDRDIPRGFLHTYQTTRPLTLLYLDGMSAAKTSMGTLDTQDLVLRDYWRNGTDLPPAHDERARARDLCDVVKHHGIDGIVRMEIGFEIIYCDFGDGGIEFLSALRQPDPKEDVRPSAFMNLFEWTRAVGARYDGIGGGRAIVHFSDSVSGFFYGINLTNEDPTRGDLPRFATSSRQERDIIRRDALNMFHPPKHDKYDGINWQADVVDMIVDRYAHRIRYLADDICPGEIFVDQILVATNVFSMLGTDGMDGNSAAARQRCADMPLRSVLSRRTFWTEVDELLYTAIRVVSSSICNTFFDAREKVFPFAPQAQKVAPNANTSNHTPRTNLSQAVAESREQFKALMADLRWPVWKKCGACAADEVCFIAMWPFGWKEDHYVPKCRTVRDLEGERERNGDRYWE